MSLKFLLFFVGICDLFFLLILLSQKFLNARLKPSKEFHATVLEVRPLKGFGAVMSCILVHGSLQLGDTIVCAGSWKKNEGKFLSDFFR